MDRITKYLWISGVITDEQLMERLVPDEQLVLKRVLKKPSDKENREALDKIFYRIEHETDSNGEE